jgi:DNA repair protein RadC
MKRASALLAHFGSLARLFAADAAQLEAVPGIGAVGAARLARLFQLALDE